MKLSVINPNTTRSMTETIASAARGVAAIGTEIAPQTSEMGRFRSRVIMMKPLPCRGCCSNWPEPKGRGPRRPLSPVLTIPVWMQPEPWRAYPFWVSASLLLRSPPSLPNATPSSRPWNALRIPIEDLCVATVMQSAARCAQADIPVLSLEDPNSNARDRLRSEIATSILEDRAEAIILGCAGMAELAASLQQSLVCLSLTGLPPPSSRPRH